MSRPSDVETFMRMAEVAAQRSLCDRARVGALIVSYDQIVIATGRNGPPRGFPHGELGCTAWCNRELFGYDGCPSIHAETNALLTSDRTRRMGGTIYVTGEMCWDCAKLVANSGLGFAVVLKNDADYERRRSQRGYDLLRSVGVHVKRYERIG